MGAGAIIDRGVGDPGMCTLMMLGDPGQYTDGVAIDSVRSTTGGDEASNSSSYTSGPALPTTEGQFCTVSVRSSLCMHGPVLPADEGQLSAARARSLRPLRLGAGVDLTCFLSSPANADCAVDCALGGVDGFSCSDCPHLSSSKDARSPSRASIGSSLSADRGLAIAGVPAFFSDRRGVSASTFMTRLRSVGHIWFRQTSLTSTFSSKVHS